ncbi:hypothetical protein HO173_011857 [Letharia columbiana]|uniref:Uncharacterized protein n=1 Tax=Letharia columbiana TaxID=112416 RepID=A0A8H6CRI0_9LECA|nr:uncharacterized protein HO173_011857 [Letharia columbiana]KAF6228555.1 hypothetical protein HO173_011857 [Letharia columbiana]
MTSLIVSLALLVYHLSVVTASFIPLQRLGNSILSNNFIRNNTLAPLSAVNLTAATPPQGFSNDITYVGTAIFVPMEMIQPVLQSKRVVAALYKTGLAIANGNKFHKNLVFLNIEEKLAGLLAF